MLHITNITFHAEGNADSAAVTDIDQLNVVADLLQVSNEELRLSLIQESNVTRGLFVCAYVHTCHNSILIVYLTSIHENVNFMG